MGLTECKTIVNIHSSLPDAPALTATELKTAWDSAAVGLKDYINNTLIDELDPLLDSIPDIINDITTGGTTKALSAEAGKTLLQKKITSGTVPPSGGTDGDIYLRYS